MAQGQTNKVVIVGGGVVGLCCAYYARQAGFEVSVLERNDISDGCSFGNMGYIAPSHFTPLATPGIISQGLKWMLSSSSPFYIKPRLNWDLFKWATVFWKKADAKVIEKNAPHLSNLLWLSRKLMSELKQTLPTSFDMTERGCWMLYQSAKTADAEKRLAERAETFGLKTVVCNGAEVQDYEKEVEVKVAGGVLYLDDCHVNPAKFVASLYSALRALGVTFHLNSEVVGVEKNGGEITAVITTNDRHACGELVIANGAWMAETAELLGIKLLLQPGKGYSVVYDQVQKNLRYPSILVDDRGATTPIGNWLRIGGTMELSGYSTAILPKRVLAIYHAVKKYYPSLSIDPPDPERAWFGYRPVTPDGLPYIGRDKNHANLCFAGGHAMLGMSAAAATGKLVGEILSHKKTSIDVGAFDPQRL